VFGVEALVRWHHPRLGLLAPDRFIGIAEGTGLIDALTDRVLELALAQVAEWRRGGLELTVAVNLSARCLLQDGFAACCTRVATPSWPGSSVGCAPEPCAPPRPRPETAVTDAGC
jgi:EAL domain-containing protein (putative c-di-GMP-specific phosphodiesterase class I)